MPTDAESRVDARRLTGDEPTALRERAERARAEAVAAAQRCVCLAAEVARLKSASDGKHAALSAARHELEETTSRFARLLKLLDTPPERAVTLLKEAVTEHVPLHGREGRAIMEDVVRWGVRAFYEGVA
jgi:hypothetical protein